MDLVIIDMDTPEWDYIWNWLEKHPFNKDIPEPSVCLNNGEAWQYMGSFTYGSGNKLIHTLRHRSHPLNNGLLELHLISSDDFTPDQIMKKK